MVILKLFPGVQLVKQSAIVVAGRKTRKAWVGLHKKMNKEGEFLEKCGFSSSLAWCTVLKAVDLKMLRQECVIVAIKRQMKFTFFKRNFGAANSKKFVKHSPLVRDS